MSSTANARVPSFPAAWRATSTGPIQLDLGAKVVWAISGPYTLQFSLDIFNILNMQTAQWVDQNYTFDFVTPMQGAQCSSKNAARRKNPIAALQADCPDLPYARTHRRPARQRQPQLRPARRSGNARVGAYQAPDLGAVRRPAELLTGHESQESQGESNEHAQLDPGGIGRAVAVLLASLRSPPATPILAANKAAPVVIGVTMERRQRTCPAQLPSRR